MHPSSSRIFLCILLATLLSLPAHAQCEKEALKFQKQLNKQFRDPDDSPLTPEDRAHFAELDPMTVGFYPIDPDFCVEATWVPTPQEKDFEMPTSNVERSKTYKKYGELHFEIRGQKLEINVYQRQNPNQKRKYRDLLFIPFTDLTTGNDSYGGGRYIDWKLPKEGKPVRLDFNQCYNPYCAYSTGWSCPIPPEENFLDIRVEAGVKAWGH
jgi:uncharacterized protein (DUF1684 family)